MRNKPLISFDLNVFASGKNVFIYILHNFAHRRSIVFQVFPRVQILHIYQIFNDPRNEKRATNNFENFWQYDIFTSFKLKLSN